MTENTASQPTTRRGVFSSERSLIVACCVVPLLYGFYSLALGADANWDLRNYHWYIGFAYLHDKIGIDLAPGGMQSYFNPTLDLAYRFLVENLPPKCIGFLMGVVHGLNFVLLLGIGKIALSDHDEGTRNSTAFWLAIAGMCTGNFMSGIGNSMGDNTTALFSLAALLIVLRVWNRIHEVTPQTLAAVVAAGIVSGLGTGLKLTTVPYAVALCGSVLLAPLPLLGRVRVAFLFGVGVIVGLSITGGYWFAEMWRLYGNPVYPQFSAVFPSPLTSGAGVVDKTFLPRSFGEALIFPFEMSANSHRVGQVTIRQAYWAMAYVLLAAWLLSLGVARIKRRPSATLNSPAQYVIAYVAIGFVLWLKLFGIQRYLVALELCVPLVIYVLLVRLLPLRKARFFAGVGLTVSSLVVLIGGAHSWGHAPWGPKMFSADIPPLSAPDKLTVILPVGDPPFGFLVPMFPDNVAFVAFGQGVFPINRDAYTDKVHQIIRTRGGDVFAVVPVGWDHDHVDEAKNSVLLTQSEAELRKFGLTLDPTTCTVYRAYIGIGVYPYRWCRITGIDRNAAIRD